MTNPTTLADCVEQADGASRGVDLRRVGFWQVVLLTMLVRVVWREQDRSAELFGRVGWSAEYFFKTGFSLTFAVAFGGLLWWGVKACAPQPRARQAPGHE